MGDEVAAVLLAWYPGQEFGNALADVLLGAAEPGGRLPTTWPLAEQGLPSCHPVDGRLVYEEGLHLGYRAAAAQDRPIRYPFGHGLGYSSWEYPSLSAPASVGPPRPFEVDVAVRDAGARPEPRSCRCTRAGPTAGSSVRRDGSQPSGTSRPARRARDRAPEVAARALEHWDRPDGSVGSGARERCCCGRAVLAEAAAVRDRRDRSRSAGGPELWSAA